LQTLFITNFCTAAVKLENDKI